MSVIEEVTHEGDGYTVWKYSSGRIVLRATTRGVDAMPPRWVGECTRHRVQYLVLSDTEIRELPESLTGCRDLVVLSLGGNGLVEIPSTVPKLTRLTELWLYNNRLERVTEDIGHLLNLEVLILNGNRSLAQLPPKVGHSWKKLRRLYCPDTALPWAAERALRGFRLRELQLAEHGAQALPTHQSGEPAIDSLVIYCDQDREIVTTKLKDGGNLDDHDYNISLCGKLENQGHHCCTPASDLDCIRLGLHNCKAVVVCLSDSLPLAILSEVLQSQKPIMAVKLYQQALPQQMEEQLSGLKAQGFLVEYQEDNIDVISQKLAQLIKDSSTPTAIILRGPAAVKVFNEASSEGVGCDTRFRAIVIGQERSGKTSLVKLLTGRKFNPKERMTHVIDVNNIRTVEGAWNRQETKKGARYHHNDQDFVTARDIAKKIKQENKDKSDRENQLKKSRKIQSPDKKNAPEDSRSITSKDVESTSATATATATATASASTSSQPIATPLVDTEDIASFSADIQQLPEPIFSMVKDLLENDRLEDASESMQLEISIWDFGGQYFYYTTHQVFLSSAAIFIVVFDLSKRMLDPATDWTEDGFTNGQVLEFWLKSICTYAKGSEPLSVLLVGTHANQVTGQQKYDTLKYLDDLLKQKKFCETFMQDNCLDNIFYTIENSVSLEKNPEAQRLKSGIEKKVIPGLMKKRQKRPLRWLEFEKRLRNTDNNHNFSTLDKVKHVAVECKVVKDAEDEETLLTILQFLHDIGVVLYYGKDDAALRDLVILSPEWLLDIFKKLIIVPKPGRKKGNLIQSWKKLEESHILEKVLSDFVLGCELEDHKVSIINIMKKFDLLCERVRRQQPVSHYVPFVLVRNRKNEVCVNRREPTRLHPGSDTIFHIDFHGFLPGGLFHRLVVKMLGWSEQTSRVVNMPEPTIYYRYLAANIDIDHVVSLEWMKQSRIKVVIKNCTGQSKSFPEPSIFHHVLEFLKSNLLKLQTMGMHDLECDFYVYLQDYPECEHTEGEVSHLCRLQLQYCLDHHTPTVLCPEHPTSRVCIGSILPRFTVTPQQGASPSPPIVGQQAHPQPPPPPPPLPLGQGPITASHHHPPSIQTSADLHPDQSGPAPPSHMITASQSEPAPPSHMTTASQSGPAHVTAASHPLHHLPKRSKPNQPASGQTPHPPAPPSLTPAAATAHHRPHPPAPGKTCSRGAQRLSQSRRIQELEQQLQQALQAQQLMAESHPGHGGHESHEVSADAGTGEQLSWSQLQSQADSQLYSQDNSQQTPAGQHLDQSRPTMPGHVTAASHSQHPKRIRLGPASGQAHEPVPAASLTLAATALNRPPPPVQGFRESLQVETSGGGASSVTQVETSGGGASSVTHIHVEGTYAPHAQFTGPAVLARDPTTVTICSPAGGQQGEQASGTPLTRQLSSALYQQQKPLGPASYLATGQRQASPYPPPQQTMASGHTLASPCLRPAAPTLTQPHQLAWEAPDIVLLKLLDNLQDWEAKRLKFHLEKRGEGPGIPAGRMQGADKVDLAKLMVAHLQPISVLKETLSRALRDINRADMVERGHLDRLLPYPATPSHT